MGIERMGTHSDGCYKWHLECAAARVEELRARVAALREAMREIAHDHEASGTQCRLALADALMADEEAQRHQWTGPSAGGG